MSPRKSFHVADKISCRQKLTHVRAKIISCRQNAFHVAKTFSCRQKYFSCRQKLNFMSPNLFHVTEKVDFSDAPLFVCLFVCFVCPPARGQPIRYACMLVCGDFIYTLEIIARILREVVNRERLCGTNAQSNLVASAIFGAVRPLAEVMTQSIFVWVVG